MFGWLKEFVSGVPSAERAERWRVEDEAKARAQRSTADAAPKEPLSFDYEAKDGERSRVHLRRWRQDGRYVHGISLEHDRELTYRLDRIIRFHDLSYRQLRDYRAPGGSPVDPQRLP